ncbi:mucin 2 [Plakobranchus ocellatus]|uniref:Mucin 2 n=1 Tax=Plakobranchus ocellatus TaxID=259542 RepID=A0AAV4D3Y3_9GAST|nr:mucin 2 [Plakobranchus ocellatus]
MASTEKVNAQSISLRNSKAKAAQQNTHCPSLTDCADEASVSAEAVDFAECVNQCSIGNERKNSQRRLTKDDSSNGNDSVSITENGDQMDCKEKSTSQRRLTKDDSSNGNDSVSIIENGDQMDCKEKSNSQRRLTKDDSGNGNDSVSITGNGDQMDCKEKRNSQRRLTKDDSGNGNDSVSIIGNGDRMDCKEKRNSQRRLTKGDSGNENDFLGIAEKASQSLGAMDKRSSQKSLKKEDSGNGDDSVFIIESGGQMDCKIKRNSQSRLTKDDSGNGNDFLGIAEKASQSLDGREKKSSLKSLKKEDSGNGDELVSVTESGDQMDCKIKKNSQSRLTKDDSSNRNDFLGIAEKASQSLDGRENRRQKSLKKEDSGNGGDSALALAETICNGLDCKEPLSSPRGLIKDCLRNASEVLDQTDHEAHNFDLTQSMALSGSENTKTRESNFKNAKQCDFIVDNSDQMHRNFEKESPNNEHRRHNTTEMCYAQNSAKDRYTSESPMAISDNALTNYRYLSLELGSLLLSKNQPWENGVQCRSPVSRQIFDSVVREFQKRHADLASLMQEKQLWELEKKSFQVRMQQLEQEKDLTKMAFETHKLQMEKEKKLTAQSYILRQAELTSLMQEKQLWEQEKKSLQRRIQQLEREKELTAEQHRKRESELKEELQKEKFKNEVAYIASVTINRPSDLGLALRNSGQEDRIGNSHAEVTELPTDFSSSQRYQESENTEPKQVSCTRTRGHLAAQRAIDLHTFAEESEEDDDTVPKQQIFPERLTFGGPSCDDGEKEETDCKTVVEPCESGAHAAIYRRRFANSAAAEIEEIPGIPQDLPTAEASHEDISNARRLIAENGHDGVERTVVHEEAEGSSSNLTGTHQAHSDQFDDFECSTNENVFKFE